MTHGDIMLKLGIKYVWWIFNKLFLQCDGGDARIPIIGTINETYRESKVPHTNLLVASTLSFVRPQ
jgi:hypothetical protein